MRSLVFLCAAFWLLATPVMALDSGTARLSMSQTVWVEATDSTCEPQPGTTCFFGFTAADANSRVFFVPGATAVACMDGDTGDAAAATTEVKFWRVIADGTKAGSLLPSASATASLTDADADCFTMVTGLWWIEVVSVQAGKTGLVTVTGGR